MTIERVLQTIWTLLVQFWREKTGKLKPAPVEMPVEPAKPFSRTHETQAAIHEAGHTIAAWFCAFVADVKSVHIAVSTHGGASGETHYQGDLSAHRAQWCYVVIALAGIAAEAKVFKRWHAGKASTDLLRARELATSVVGTKAPWKALDAPEQRFELAYEPALTAGEVQTLRQAYVMARLLLDKHEVRFYRCAGLLLHRRKVSSTDLTAALGSRSFTKLAAMLSGFWLP